jgi:hypothetical protein
MKNIEPGQVATLIANLGVILGIFFLAYELRQNNELMEAEARLNRTIMAIDAWRSTSQNPHLAELREKEKQGETLSSAEVRQIDAEVMAVLVMIEWAFGEHEVDSSEVHQIREVQRQNFAERPEYNRVWQSRKHSFNAQFVEWMEANVVNDSR